MLSAAHYKCNNECDYTKCRQTECRGIPVEHMLTIFTRVTIDKKVLLARTFER